MGDDQARLRRCVRDLAALNALPSLCVGHTPEESLDILIDALPTVLDCDLIYFVLPGAARVERSALDRGALAPAQLDQVRAASVAEGDGAHATVFLGGATLSCLEAEIPLGAQRGRLLAGRRAAMDPETDRVLVRTAANLIGTIMETANVLDVARRKDDFLAMLGHELRNPLAPIVTAVELLRDNAAVTRERDVIERHTHHLIRIVDDLLDISRVTKGHIELRREQVALGSVLQRAVEIATPQLTRKRHRLEVADAEARAVTLEGDPIRLAQIFANLLTNAAKFTPPGGRIDVGVAQVPGGRVQIVIRDNGVGIAPDQLRRIFEPFVQADRARDVLQGGLGLGLAIVGSLVERHHGSINAHSDGRGHGATFTVELPTVRAAAVHPLPAAPQPLDARAQMRVLVVDDNIDLADLVSDGLQVKGFQTTTAHDGTEALAAWRRFLPHAGVVDVGLPGMDGYDVARAIRAEYGASPTLIAVTGFGRPTDRSRAAEAGFDVHLPKPVSLDELVKVLDQKVVPES